MKKIIILCLCISFASAKVSAQFNLGDFNLQNLLGKTLSVKRGFAPKFSVGNININKIFKVATLIGFKKNDQANKLFNTFKTGRIIYRAAAYAGSAYAAYGLIKSTKANAIAKDYKGALTGGLSAIAAGLVTKLLTKGAAYKATDVFNGLVKNKIKNIFSIAPASKTLGMGLYVKL